MRARIADIVASYRLTPPPLPADEVAEAVAFLEWLADDNFTFLGVREYRLPRATSPPIRSRDRASASCATRPCGCCAAGANSS